MKEIIELLRCASINCDNTKKIGIRFVDFVKIQIDEAIEKLEKIPVNKSDKPNPV